MLSLPSNVQLFAAPQPVDGRKSFNGLVTIVQSEFMKNPTEGDIFLFINKRGNLLRILFWDRNGFWLMAKRLEAGSFQLQRYADSGQSCVELDSSQLVMILEGIDLRSIKKRKRFNK